MEAPWVTDFKENALYRIEESSRMVNIALAKANENQLWQPPNGNSNSLGNLIMHLCGNMTQYVISSLGEKEDLREREKEFDITKGLSKAELLQKLQATVKEVTATITQASEEKLLKKRLVQGFYFSGMGCVIHAVEHYSYHTGQIAFWVKQLMDAPLGFYDGMELNKKNN